MGKNQGFLSVNLSKARDNSTWAVSWLAELTVTPSPLPPFPPSPPGVRLGNLRVWSQNVPVCTGTTPACGNTCARGAGTHGDALNLHTDVCSACQAAPHTTPHTHTTQHNTTHSTTHTHTTQHHNTQHHTETERDRDRDRQTERETESDRERDRERETRQDKKREDETIKEKKLEDGRGETRR